MAETAVKIHVEYLNRMCCTFKANATPYAGLKYKLFQY